MRHRREGWASEANPAHKTRMAASELPARTFLQWPHQGAWNLTKTDFPFVAASHVDMSSSMADTSIRLRSMFISVHADGQCPGGQGLEPRTLPPHASEVC